MHPVDELKQLREQMVERLTRIPEYQALKAMERFIAEMSSIYESGAAAPTEQTAAAPAAPTAASAQTALRQTPTVIEGRAKGEAGAASPRVTPYIPAHRVA